MATQEKLMKSLENLQQLITSNQVLDPHIRKKEKIQHCNFITEAMSNSTIKIAPNFSNLLSFAIENLLKLIDDPESDVRMIADESLNRIIKAMSNGNIGKVQVELHKEIKKNGSAKSLRAALVRFSQLAYLIKPHKGKPYVANLIPCIIKISEREEDAIHETLSDSLPPIMATLGCFTADNDIKALIKCFLNNIKNASAVKRRAAANCILSICLHCKKTFVFVTYVLNNLIDSLIPVQHDLSATQILGVLGTLKLILPYTQSKVIDEEIQGTFGIKVEVNEVSLEIDRFLQVYEICLYYICHENHNVVNAALETLNILLQHVALDVKASLLSSSGLPKSYLFQKNSNYVLKHRSESQLSVATTFVADDAIPLDSEILDSKTDIEKWIDESKLSVVNVAYVKPNRSDSSYDKSVEALDGCNSSFESIEPVEYSNLTIGTIYTDALSEPSRSDDGLLNAFDKVALSDDTSSEKSSSLRILEDKSNFSIIDDDMCDDVDIGQYTDKDVPLLYASRLITKSFLLTGIKNGLVSDKKVRVTVKNLAITCLSTIIQINPAVLLLPLDKRSVKGFDEKQFISDVILFENHSDPQLRGTITNLTSSFLKSVLDVADGNFTDWMTRNALTSHEETFTMASLLNNIYKGLTDQSSTCVRHSLAALRKCLKSVLSSNECDLLRSIFDVLPSLSQNPYWLVKVKFLELISDVNYMDVHYVIGSNQFQDKIIYNVLFELLKDDDQRVRTACSKSIVNIIPNLYYPNDDSKEGTLLNKAIEERHRLLGVLDDALANESMSKRTFIENMPFPFSAIETCRSERIRDSLSRILRILHRRLLKTTSKQFLFGCLETLSALSVRYPTTVYYDAWNCQTNFVVKLETNLLQRSLSTTPSPPAVQEMVIANASDLLNVCVNMLNYNIFVYDFNFHSHLLRLTGNIFAAKCYKNINPRDVNAEESAEVWDVLTDKNLSIVAEAFLNHIVKLLNIFYNVVEDIMPVPPQTKTLPNLPSASNLSPLKRRKSDLGEKKALSPVKSPEKEDKAEKKDVKVNSLGSFINVPHYVKIYELVKTAYNNYKITLDVHASENFLNLVRATLNTLSQILEVATFVESRRMSEEVLHYLRTIFVLDPTSTVECVQQMLRSLFGCNLTSNITEILALTDKKNEAEVPQRGFYGNIFQKPYSDLTKCINNLHSINKLDFDGDSTVMGYLHRRDAKKINLAKGSGATLANYIKIFEPMVIKSLKQYAITSNTELQGRVLQLLSQLVQLRVNYCLLDSDKIFIRCVLKQFEFIDEGQIPRAETLIPKIFQFLVYLSYEKQHSKCIISVPKLIQLCDGLLASGQPPITHCIPALKPFVEDIFLMRNKSNTTDMKELETTREVLMSMLLRLIEYKEVMNLICLILNESKYSDQTDRWFNWSQQVMSALIPKLKTNKIRIDDVEAFRSLKRLVFTVHFDAFKPIDGLVVTLFQDPPSSDDSLVAYERWMGKVLILFLILSQVKEDVFLDKILETKTEFGSRAICRNRTFDTDPLNVTKATDFYDGMPGETIFNRFVFQTLDVYAERTVALMRSDENDFAVKEFALFLIHCLYIYQSGSHCKTAVSAINLIKNETELKKFQIDLDKINANFIRISRHFPVLTFEWCYLLTLLNYDNTEFWASVMRADQTSPRTFLNRDILQTGSAIVYCDFLSENMSNKQLKWFLTDNIDVITKFSNEIPVFELIATVGRNAESSSLLLEALSFDYQDVDVNVKINVLKSLENVHVSVSGDLLKFLIYNVLNTKELAVSRLVANLASRKIEYLLTLKPAEVNNQLSKEDVLQIVNYLEQQHLSKKHKTLFSLLNKLCVQFYDLTPVEHKQNKAIDPNLLKTIDINKGWYLAQLKAKCRSDASAGKEIPELLTKLQLEDLETIMNADEFSLKLQTECLRFIRKRTLSLDSTEDHDFFKATVNCLTKRVANLMRRLPLKHEVYNVTGRARTDAEEAYSVTLNQFFADKTNLQDLSHLMSSVVIYMELRSKFHAYGVSEESRDSLSLFPVICLEAVTYFLEVCNSIEINFIDLAIRCAERCLKQSIFVRTYSSDNHISWLCSCVNSVFVFIKRMSSDDRALPSIQLNCLNRAALPQNARTLSAGHACRQITNIILWFERNVNGTAMSDASCRSLKSIIVALSRLPLLNSFALAPPCYLKVADAIELTGTFRTLVPPLPISYLQEIEILEEFIFRMTLLGWTSRQQFEEMWMSLLSVLSATPDDKLGQDELNNVVHAMGLAVRAITALLIETLDVPVCGNRNVSQILHIPRDNCLQSRSASVVKLRDVQTYFENEIKYKCGTCTSLDWVTNVFGKCNVEKLENSYSYGQLSLEYLLIQTSIVDNSENEETLKCIYERNNMLQDSGLDVNSCLQFLLDLYSQWILQQPSPPLRLLYEIVKSIISISDLFTEKSQFVWMLNSCLDLSKNHMIEDDIIHQYLCIGICKAAAVVSPDMETYVAIQKIISQSLKTSFLPTRIATLHGLLYVLQSCLINNTVIGGISEELQLFLPVVLQYIRCSLSENNLLKQSQEHQLLLWSVSFYLIENVNEAHLEQDFVTFVIRDVIEHVKFNKLCTRVSNSLMKALERLVIKQCLPDKLNDSVTKLALEMMKDKNPLIALPSVQLLITCMYKESAIQLENTEKSNGIVQSNPDNLVQTIEKVAAVFDRIRKGCPFEAEILCNILPKILNDFFPPSDIFTKVIGEFLAPQQRHVKLLSRVVFEVFENAIEQSQLSLLQEWVVFSLSNFTQSLPLGMSTWCLTCFFVSASTNKWLRSMFPYVQSRIGRYEYEDRKMLCIASADFYKNLAVEQKRAFVDTFNKVRNDSDTPFNDLLSSL